MVSEAQTGYYERINQIKQHIRQHVDEPLDREQLAKLAGFSIPHFHRIFIALVGESISAYVKRVRMERAAQQLRTADIHVTQIALDSGYESHAAFSKAFKQCFGVSPSEFRQLNPTLAAYLLQRRMMINRKELPMKPIEIRTLPDMQVLYARAIEHMSSPAFQRANQEAFGKLMGFLSSNGLMAQMKQCIAIYPDEVEVGKVARFDAGAIFAEGIQPAAPEGMAYQTLPAGRWAVFRHVGPYDTLWQTWQAVYRDWLPSSGETLRDAISFEAYVDDPSQVTVEKLRTDICIPIQ